MTPTPSAAWTQPREIKHLLLRRWKQGVFLGQEADKEADNDEDHLFPYRLSLKKPSSKELSENFEEVRRWIRSWDAIPLVRIDTRTFNHPVLGKNSLPDVGWVDSLEDLVSLIDKHAELKAFKEICERTRKQQPQLLPWLGKYPMQALRHSEAWPALLMVVDWLQANPQPAKYLRQMDVPGVHTKFVENHRQILSSLLDLSLPEDMINKTTSNFQSRYGFLNKPERIRFRFLDIACNPYPHTLGSDLQINSQAFAKLAPEVTQVFITENEINYLAFPRVPASLLIFGSGYGFEHLCPAVWLKEKRIRYWGDIDTHGFAILDQFRHHFPHTESFLMDQQTLLHFRSLWGTEPSPSQRKLSKLLPSESKLHQEIQNHTYAPNLRLEQERIGYEWLQKMI